MHKQKLFCGFRGPVFRGNYAAVLVFRFDDPAEYDVRFINLGGLGIRDITRASDGFLIIAGPVGDGPGGFKLFHWNGSDEIPGADATAKHATLLGDVPAPEGARAEGIVVADEADHAYEVLIVYDGLENGGMTRMRLGKID